jgi:glycosyltransferase involved in cell wall biosynthesis
MHDTSQAGRFDVVIPLVGFNASGGIRMVIHVANVLAARGRRVAFVVPRTAARAPIDLHPSVAVVVRGPGRGWRDRVDFVARLPRGRVYVATGFQTPLLIAGGRLLRGRGGRVFHLVQADERVTHIRHGARPAWQKPALYAVAWLGSRLRAKRVAVSQAVRQAVGPDRVHRVIPPGVGGEFLERARRPARARAGDRVTIGVLAHPGAVKGVAVAFEAFARLSGRGWRFLAFEGAHPMALPPFVEAFARVPTAAASGIVDFYEECDVFVFPSLAEGFGLPPLEAMACGAAVVAADCGGVREYARDGLNCLLVPPASADAIATAVSRLASDASLRDRLARAGRETALRFPVDRFAAECADEIERLLDTTR